MKKRITKLGDKLSKVNESFTVNMYDNGYMIEVNGRDSEGEWKSAKIMCAELDGLIDLIKEAVAMDRAD